MGGGNLFGLHGCEVRADDGGAGFLGQIEQRAVGLLHAVGVKGGEAHSGLQTLHGVEGAEVEGLQDHAAGEAVGADYVAHQFGEALRRWGLVGLGRGDLGFDVELDLGAFGFDEVEDLLEGGDAGAGDGLLFGEAGVGLGAAVVLLKLKMKWPLLV